MIDVSFNRDARLSPGCETIQIQPAVVVMQAYQKAFQGTFVGPGAREGQGERRPVVIAHPAEGPLLGTLVAYSSPDSVAG